jgi:hypothetical protein
MISTLEGAFLRFLTCFHIDLPVEMYSLSIGCFAQVG